MRRNILCLMASVLIPCSISAQSTLGLQESIGPIVIQQSDTLDLAWAGGFHNPQIGHMDWNGDGIFDLWVFEKVGQRQIPMIREWPVGRWIYKPSHRNSIQGLRFFALSIDWNNDGSKDVVGYRWDGLQVFLNQAPAGQPALFSKPPLRCISQYGIGSSGLFVPQDDLPALADLDQDGDIDVLTFPLFGSCLEWHKNLSMETYGVPDSTYFKLESSHWGYFKEGININSIVLNDSCMGTGGLAEPLHSGAGRALLAVDLNADGLLDLVMSEGGSQNIAWLKNGGSLSNARITELNSTFPSSFSGSPMVMDVFPAAFYADADADGTSDLIIGTAGTDSPADALGTYLYLNLGSENQPVFNGSAKPFLQSEMVDLGMGAYPVAGDINGDGIYDIVVGSSSQNGQTARLYSMLSNPDSSFMFGPLAGNNGSTLSNYDLVPSLGDLDNDGDLDLAIGTQTGGLWWIENIGTATQPYFSGVQVELAPNLGQTYAAPELFDADGDGDLDLLVGGRNGRLAFYRNQGSMGHPQFSGAETTFLGQVETIDPSVGSAGYSIPRIFQNQGNTEIMVGTYRGTLWHYSNLFDNVGQFQTAFTLVTDRLGYADIGIRSAPAVLVRSGSSYPDVVLGGLTGGLLFYKGEMADLSFDANFSGQAFAYPNPAVRGGLVNLSESNSIHSWRIRSILGQNLLAGTGHWVPTQNLDPGIYWIYCETKKGTEIIKLNILNP